MPPVDEQTDRHRSNKVHRLSGSNRSDSSHSRYGHEQSRSQGMLQATQQDKATAFRTVMKYVRTGAKTGTQGLKKLCAEGQMLSLTTFGE